MDYNSTIIPFSSTRSLSKWVKIIIIAGIALTIINSISELSEINLLSAMIHDVSSVTTEEMNANDLRTTITTLFSSIIVLAGMILFFIWFYKSYRNLQSLGGKEIKPSPRRAVVDFFIPFLCLYKPYGHTAKIWKVSDPSIPITDNDSRRQMETPSLIKIWWAFWIITGIIGTFYLRSLPYIMSINTLNGLMGFDYIDVFTNIPNIISDLLTFFLVSQISSRQEKKRQLSTNI